MFLEFGLDIFSVTSPQFMKLMKKSKNKVRLGARVAPKSEQKALVACLDLR